MTQESSMKTYGLAAAGSRIGERGQDEEKGNKEDKEVEVVEEDVEMEKKRTKKTTK